VQPAHRSIQERSNDLLGRGVCGERVEIPLHDDGGVFVRHEDIRRMAGGDLTRIVTRELVGGHAQTLLEKRLSHRGEQVAAPVPVRPKWLERTTDLPFRSTN
jgi:hypothetical protein